MKDPWYGLAGRERERKKERKKEGGREKERDLRSAIETESQMSNSLQEVISGYQVVMVILRLNCQVWMINY